MPSVVVPKFVVSRTPVQVARLGARGAVMLAHRKARATTTEEPAKAPEGSLIRPYEGRRRRLTMLWHRRRDASCPEDRISDPRYDEFRNHHTSPLSGRDGFTLIELLVVLVVMGLLVSLGPIAFQKVVPGMALKSSAREVMAVFHEARGIAIRDNREAIVIIDVDARTYRLGGRPSTRELDPGLELELVTAESERIGESQGRIRFYPDGTSTGGRLTLSRNERKYHVVVDWITGRAALQD